MRCLPTLPRRPGRRSGFEKTLGFGATALRPRKETSAPKKRAMVIVTTRVFWNCKCPDNSVHSKDQERCRCSGASIIKNSSHLNKTGHSQPLRRTSNGQEVTCQNNADTVISCWASRHSRQSTWVGRGPFFVELTGLAKHAHKGAGRHFGSVNPAFRSHHCQGLRGMVNKRESGTPRLNVQCGGNPHTH